MTCTFPHCEPGQAGTHCRPECRTNRICCDGKCNQGRNCPLTEPDPLRSMDDTESQIFEAVALFVAGVLGVIVAIGLVTAWLRLP